MSDKEALKIFSRQPVSLEMIDFLVSTTNSIIQVKKSSTSTSSSNTCRVKTISLTEFIKNLINYSNVQTPTLMSTLYYLNKLRNHLPANAVGMETTRHRIFLSCLILAAKSLNDSSPLNKHWTKYTNGLLNLYEINLAERELINLLNWNLKINESNMILLLQPFLLPIKQQLILKHKELSIKKLNYYKLSYKPNSSTSSSLASASQSSSSINSYNSNYSLSSSNSNYSLISNTSSTSSYSDERIPLSNKSINNLPSLPILSKKMDDKQLQQQYQYQSYSQYQTQYQQPYPQNHPQYQQQQHQKSKPIIKRKRSMMNYLNNSRIIN
ncbi:PCL2 [Candida pseudojiufengensis]|uniref:PCL2 n=1 Tax=Candida pseudojiufengensis TaxID=497109 RepID=UPI002224D660|nr:PCL2 [Candida pseudojiufengensis]KAI5960155.1 PCL2 [Candida pseudojiufengensis]